jgi:cytoskeleton protein RodZ
MSEPQHPQPHHDTEADTGRPAQSGTRATMQPVAAAGPEPLATMVARLTQLRESKGWSIDDVSARLKVPVVKLRALEAGDLNQLPDTTFALGVLRAYAKMLATDPAPFVQALRRERGVPEPALSLPASSGRDLPRGRVALSLGSSAPKRRSWLWGVAAAIVAVIALAMWHTNGTDSSAWLARLKGTAASVANGVNGASGAVAQGQTGDSGAAVQGQATGPDAAASDAAASATPTQPSPDEEASQAAQQTPAAGQSPATDAGASQAPAIAPASPKAAQQGASSPAAKAASTAAATAAASNAQVAATAPASNAQPTSADQSTVAVRVTQDSWFSVRQKDGKEVFSGLVHAGDAKEVSGEPPFKVTVGNRAGLASITLDGQPVDTSKYSGAKGNVARFALP